MRLLHTSDWHLGHTLKEVTRDHEHAAFLRWLLETCVREAPDALVITGDVFDAGTPPASAERMWFEFLAAARRARPAMDIVAIAGNHDSPARLGASSAVLRELGVHVIGGLPRLDGSIDLDRVLIPVAGGQGLVAAVPFLRPIDIPVPVEDPLATVYGEVLAGARDRRRPEQALIVLGHLYVTGADPSYLSERRISIGGQESASLRLFPDDIDYVALGHMHRAQRVGRDSIRYAGAPIALSLDEAGYRHGVVVVDFEGGRVRDQRVIDIPQTVEIVRIPARGAAPLAEVVAAISALPPRLDADDPARPYLEIVVALDRPEPRLRTQVETALDGERARLVQLHVQLSGDGAALGDRVQTKRLAELDPRDVFAQLWARSHADPPSAAVTGAFERLLAEVQGDLDDPERAAKVS
ncbi:MAG: exonuclease subunit SbcD [Kofleriaceae bacterium]|nr:exonuclease subunit SbcD [Kofleriaceae bacterium]